MCKKSLSSNIKIALLIPGMSTRAGGVSPVVAAHQNELLRMNARSAIISLDPLGKTFYDKIPLLKQWRYHPRYLKTIEAYSPDIVHCHGIWMYHDFAGWRYAATHGVPLIISPHGMLDPWSLKNSYLKKKIIATMFENRVLRQTSCFHALCESEYESIRAFGLTNPVAIIPNGITLPADDKHICLPGRKRMLFLGRLHPKKGLPELLQAWDIVRRTDYGRDWQLIIAGWSQYGHYEELQELCRRLRLDFENDFENSGAFDSSKEVVFVGAKYGEDKDYLLRTADAFILPSKSEGLPMSVLEAWSYSLPCILTPACNIPEGFECNAAVKIAPDVSVIASGLTDFMGLPEVERAAMGGNGRALVGSTFSWPGIAADMQAVYQWCAGRGSVPGCVRLQ